jgi:hypothetical protein
MSHWASLKGGWDTSGPSSTSSNPRHSAPHSTLSAGSSSTFTPQYTLASRNSRINHGSFHPARHAPSGDHRSRYTNAHPYHEARGKSTPSPALMDFRILTSGQMLFYLRDHAEANRTVEEFREKLKGPLGLDIEYRPNFTKGRPLNKTALVQLASESVALLVQVSAMSGENRPSGNDRYWLTSAFRIPPCGKRYHRRSHRHKSRGRNPRSVRKIQTKASLTIVSSDQGMPTSCGGTSG